VGSFYGLQPPVYEVTNHGDEVFQVGRFHHVGIGAALIASPDVFRVAGAAEDDYG
jgi:hypothetical protein